MNNKSQLKQQRKMQIDLINVSPETMAIVTYNQIDNGFGVMVDNLSSPLGTVTLKYRVFHEQKRPDGNSESPGGFSTNLSRAIMTDYLNDLTQAQDLSITYEGAKYKIGAVDPLKKFEGVYGYQAPLEAANNL